jgi:hypothetical protein
LKNKGDGRIFVAAHDCYLHWLKTENQDTDVKKKFMRRVREWLTVNNRILGPDVDFDDSKLDNFNEIVRRNEVFERYRIVICSYSFNGDESAVQRLLNYVENGGLPIYFH